MAKKRSLKTALVMAIMSIVACLAMFAGTTFAWFTDSVTSSNNIIASGRLDVTMEYKNKLSDTEWKDASKNAIFDYQNWEPGYTEVKYVKIANEGTLAFKYELKIYPNMLPGEGEVNIADVIDVYVVDVADDGSQGVTKANLIKTGDDKTYVDNMTNVFKNGTVLIKGELKNENDTNIVAIVLQMKTNIGNEYMGLSVGDGFTVQLVASQLASEEDSFGSDYDADVPFDGVPMALVTKSTGDIGRVIDNIDDGDGKGQEIIFGGTTYEGLYLEDSFVLDTAYQFDAPKTEDIIDESIYGDWEADFEVSIDRYVEEAAIGLAGNYGGYGWIGFTNPIEVSANTPVRLVSQFFHLTYADVVKSVKIFKCGAWCNKDSLAGATMTVALKLYEVNEDGSYTGNQLVIGKYTYTFDVVEKAPVAIVDVFSETELGAVQEKIDNDEFVTLSGMFDTPKFDNSDVEVNALYTFQTAETEEEVLSSDYKDWIVDFAVSFNNNVPTGSVGLMGQYDAFAEKWVGFALPDLSDSIDGIDANDPILLMETICKMLGLSPNNWTYADICSGVQKFNCGVFVNTDSSKTYGDLLPNTTITVELRVYNPNDRSDYVVAGSITQAIN